MRVKLCALFLVLTALVLGACSSLSPAPETSPVPKAIRFLSPETVVPSWAAGEEGLAFFAGKTAEPELEFWAVRADLSSPHISITVKGGEETGQGKVSSIFVSSFVRRNGLYAGINAAPFDPSSGKEGEERRIAGLAVSDGRILSRPSPRFDALAFYADGHGEVIAQGEAGDGVVHAAGGFHAVLRGGELTARTGETDARYPRSAAGLSADGYTLYLLVIDGRRAGSRGATEAETAVLLRSLGAESGINLDGGGSTAMAVRGRDGTTRIVNTPIHGGIPGRERGVAVCIGIGPGISPGIDQAEASD